MYLSTSTTETVTDYPYGFTLKCTKTYKVEFKANKGFRLVEQTTNPKKTGIYWNKPHCSTYSPVMILEKSDTTGYITGRAISFYDKAGVNAGCKFMGENFSLFTDVQIQHCYKYLRQTLVISKMYATTEDEKKVLNDCLLVIQKGLYEGENVFAEINYL